MSMTKLSNLIVPEVMAQMISANLPQKIKFSRIAGIDTTLVGRPGDEITVPKYGYIGDATVVPEGTPIDTSELSTSTTKVGIQKVGKAVEITDEAILSGYGDPVGEATNQLTMAIAAKVDADCFDTLLKAPYKWGDGTEVISYESIVNAVDMFDDESDSPISKVLFVHPKQLTQLRLDPEFRDINKYPTNMVMSGVIGSIAGCQIVPSKRVAAVDGKYICPLVIVDTVDPVANTSTNPAADAFSESMPALTIYMKRAVQLEADRDVLKKTTVIVSDEHYGVALSNDSKIVLATFKA